MPCEEPGCLNSGMLTGWRALMRASAEGDGLADELDRLSQQVLEHFGVHAYEGALLRAAAIGKPHPNDPRTWNLALRDELKRLLGPH
jgi:hypothetical protein